MAVESWIVEPKDAEAAALAAALDLHPLAAAMLRRRGVTTVEAARRFLHPSLDDLSDPLALPEMPGAVERVALALAAGQSIAVHGDYDVDGISATAILVRGLRALGGDPGWYLPHRFQDGYGLGLRAVEALAARGAQVLIAADCGITATESVGRARALGCDVLVLDHHVPTAERPEATIVAPPRGSGTAPFCAAGLAFAFILALGRHLGAASPLQPGLVSLAALGTIADVVPLLDDNRRLAAAGLAEMRAAPLAGIRALASVAGIADVDAWHVGWQLGPRLNAPGRLGDPSPALRLLLTDDPQEARTLADLLDATNRERQAVLGRVLAEALVQAEEDAGAPAFVVAGDGWHPGVVGLVAGRLAERYRRPVVAIALDRDAGRGSARSVEGFDLTEALGACGPHLLAFGGHAMAAGLSVTREAVPEFRRAFQARAAAGAAAWTILPRLRIDAEVRLSEVTPSLVDALERLGPFGSGNPEPLLASRGVRAVNRRLVGGGQHLRMDVTDGDALVEAIGFAMAARGELLLFTEAPIDLAFVPERDRLVPGRIRLRVQALDVPGMDPESILTDTGALLDRLFQHAAEYLDETRGDGVEEAAALYTKVVGVTFDGRQEAIAALRPGDPLQLVREPGNEHDPHAVRVLAPDGRQLGYLRAPLAGRLSPSIDAGARYRATVLTVTGGGDRSLGVNIFLERDDPDLGSAGWDVRGRPSARAIQERLPASLNGGRPLPAPHREALAAIAAGRSVVLALPPGRGWATALAGAAALTAQDGRCALLIAPLRRQVRHRTDQMTARLGAMGFRVLSVHGFQDFRERERVAAALRAGGVDVLVASAEAVTGGWVGGHAERVSAVLMDGVAAETGAVAEMFGGRPVLAVTAPAPRDTLARLYPGAEVISDPALRAALRVVDRRNTPGALGVMEEALSRDEKTLIYAGGRAECVRLARHLRERARDRSSKVGYLHGGLPARVRQIVAHAFQESRLGILVATSALDEEMLPADVRQVMIAALPPDRARFSEALGSMGFETRPLALTVLFGTNEIDARRRELAARAPDREILAAIYRVLRGWRGDAPLAWPDDATWAALSGALPHLTPATVDAAAVIFEEAGLATREMVDARLEMQLLDVGRRDLGASLRFREGMREREAFDAFARWAVRATGFELLQVAAGAAGAG